MSFYDQRRLARGDVFTAERLAAIEEELRRLGNFSGGAGIVARQSKGGLQISAVQPNTRYLAVASGDITPRSGSTAGTGQVDRQYIDSTGAIASTGEALLDVLNPSSSTMATGKSILTGLYCWVEQDCFGTWIVAPLECPP